MQFCKKYMTEVLIEETNSFYKKYSPSKYVFEFKMIIGQNILFIVKIKYNIL